MPDVYTSATFANAYEYRQRRIAYPFRDDPALGKIVTRFYEVAKGSYAEPTLDTADTEFSTAYLICAKQLDWRDGELMRYECDFATIPASRDDVDGLSVRFPGFGVTATSNAAKSVISFTPASDRKTATLEVLAHGYSISSLVGFHLVLSSGSAQFALDGHALAIGISTNTLMVALETPVPIGTPVGFVTGSVRNFSAALPTRTALTIEANTRVRCDYFLPGKSTGITSATDIIVPPSLRIYATGGSETETLAADTMPTQTEYLAMITGGHEILVQSTLGRWRGNIWERKLAFARAR